MRLSDFERKAIKKTFYKTFKKGKIYLFGSRVDDSLKGGDIDIDLYLCPENHFDNMYKKKIDFLVDLELRIGEQKIDVIISKDRESLIEREAIKNGIEL